MFDLKYLLLLLIIGCTPKSQNKKLYSISSKANCKGPSREYHTTIHSTVEGYNRFLQNYPNQSIYDAISYNDTLGFVLTADTIERMIDKPEIAVGKGHSFHMIAFNPKLVFNYSNEKYFDLIGEEVYFNFEPNSDRILSFQLTNPFDESENIEIYYSAWEKVQDIELPMKVHIIQGGKDEFFFEFYEVKINDPEFSKISFHELPH